MAPQAAALFALKSRSDAPKRPSAVWEGLQSVAYWRRNDMSYALTGQAEPGAIDARAETLVRSWLRRRSIAGATVNLRLRMGRQRA